MHHPHLLACNRGLHKRAPIEGRIFVGAEQHWLRRIVAGNASADSPETTPQLMSGRWIELGNLTALAIDQSETAVQPVARTES